MLRMQTATRPDVVAFIDGLDAFWRAQRSAQGRFNNHEAVPEISLPQYHLLEPLAEAAGPVCVGALATSAGVSAPSATRMIGGLERRGLVERTRDDEDRRLVRIALTAEGADLVERKREQIVAARTAIFDKLPASERASAASLLQSLAAAIDELHP